MILQAFNANFLIFSRLNSSARSSKMKRVILFRNGTDTDGKVVLITNSLDDILRQASRKLGVVARCLYTPQGGLIDDVGLLQDNDVLYVSNGEPFRAAPTLQGQGQTGSPCLPRRSRQTSDNDWLTLNVGGKLFSTTRATITRKEPDSMLANMFSLENNYSWSSSVDANGAFLIDRSPTYFEPVLNYLRNGTLIIDKGINPEGILEEARFFGIMSLVELVEERIKQEEPVNDQTPITRRELIMKLIGTPANHELRCQGVNFKGANLEKLDLRGINFKYAILKGCNLRGANLSYCNFERADLSYSRIDGASLVNVKMLCVNLEGCSMRGCNLEDPAGNRSNLEGANMKGVTLEGSHMTGINLRVANIKNGNLKNCDLRSAVMAGTDLENCDLSGCDLHEANLRGANLKNATFELMVNPLHMSQAVR